MYLKLEFLNETNLLTEKCMCVEICYYMCLSVQTNINQFALMCKIYIRILTIKNRFTASFFVLTFHSGALVNLSNLFCILT
jgi:hypothetical protein